MLRIVAMMMVVISHASFHGGFPQRASLLEFNNHFLNWVILGNLGVNIFILITGFFLCTKQVNAGMILKNLTQVWFYSILCGLIQILTGGPVSVKELIRMVFPTLFKEYWFFTAYFVLLMIAPYLNIFIKYGEKKQFEKCLLTMFILWCVILSFTNQDMYSSEIIRFCMYYLVGAYLRVYPDNYLATRKIRNGIAGISVFLLLFSSTAIRLMNENFTYLISETSFTNAFSVLSFGSAVGLFSIAAYHKPWANSVVNKVASCTFGVYLLHDNPFMRKLIWLKWIDNAAWYDSGFLMLRILVSALIVFVACLPVELLRQKIVAKPVLTFVQNVLNALQKKCRIAE